MSQSRQGVLGDDDQVWHEVAALDDARLAYHARTGHYVQLDQTAVLARAARYIAKMPGAVSGQRGHDTTFRVAMTLVQGFDIHPNEAMELMIDWNATCSPPWDRADLMHKVWSAHRKRETKPRGYLLRGEK